ncbi:MAG: AAA family ATPase [Polyangiaceae bacterium]
MAQLAISKDYFRAYAALPRKAQRKADAFLGKFQRDSTAAAIHLEPLHRVLDGQLRSARIGDDYRIILRAPEHGDVFLVLWADHHDEAYRWASTKQTAIHPATGSLQIYDAIHATQALTSDEAAAAEGEEATPLFVVFGDDDLFLAGVPRALLPSVRALSSEHELDLLLPHLPPEAGEVLTALAAGLDLDAALEEVLGRPPKMPSAPAPPPIDVSDVSAALARDTTQRQFRLLDDELDLDAALKHPLDVWRVFLHPRQRRIARARTKGPMRILGGAGTGKTVVALHRAGFLVREVFTKPDDRVLFTTFTVNLAHDIRAQLAKLLEPDELARIEVENLDAWAMQYLRGRGRSVRPAFEAEQAEHLRGAIEVYGVDDVSPEFYRAEWRDVIQAQGITSERDYVLAVRRYRGVPLGRADRRRLWPVFEAYRRALEQEGMLEPLDILRLAREELEAEGAPPRYRSVVVDETQDLSAEALLLLRTIAGPERPDDLFLVGDAHQRIYGRPVAMSSCGINIRGRRSQTLRLNYRTTAAICRWSLRLLHDVEVDDLDEGKADRRGYVSLREGPSPQVVVVSNAREEEDAVVSWVKRRLEGDAVPEHICIVARTHGPLVDRFASALERAGIGAVVLDQDEPRRSGVRLATMHRVKGLEFPLVALVGMSPGEVPYPSAELRSDDPIVAAQTLLRERSLVYVAASRARDDLAVFAAGRPSPLLADVMAMPAAPRGAQAAPKAPQKAVRALAPEELLAEKDEGGERDTPGTERESEAETPPADDPLDTPLERLDLPTRLANWTERNNIKTVRELAAIAPQDLLAARNLGRKSVTAARQLIEAVAQCAWEDVAAAARPGAAPPSLEAAARANDWDAARIALSDEQRATPLDEIELPARVRGYATREELVTLGDLADRSRAQLLSAKNVARRSVAGLPALLVSHFEQREHEEGLAEAGLLESFKGLLRDLDTMDRIILTRRSGLGGEVDTLQELGDTFGVTRERIRQLQQRACQRIASRPWGRVVRERIGSVLAEGAVLLDDLGQLTWWEGASDNEDVLRFVVEGLLDNVAYVVEYDETLWLSRHPSSTIEAAVADVAEKAEAVALPAPKSVLDTIAASAVSTLGPRLGARVVAQLESRMQLSDEGLVVALGTGRREEVLGILRASPEPMHIDDIFSRIGRRVRLPDEVIYFARGTVGVRQHFPDFDRWRDELVPRMVELVTSLGPERQWSCLELHEALRDERDLPDWLTPHGLAALVKDSGALNYLGRLRVALPGAPDGDERIYVHVALEELLRDAGEPVPKDELVTKLRARVPVSDIALMGVFNRPQFVRVDDERIGLLDRDVPGGDDAIAEALDHIEAVLTRRDRGLSAHHVHQELIDLSPDHSQWTEPMATSVLRNEGRFRFSQSGAVGLASWESTRVPPRFELVRRAIDEADGVVTVAAVLARIEAHYGTAISRPSLIGFAHKLGASVDGEWIRRHPASPGGELGGEPG